MKIDDKITESKMIENVDLLKSSNSYKDHKKSIEMMMAYLTRSSKYHESSLPPIILLRLMCEKADGDSAYKEKLGAYLNDCQITDRNQIKRSTVFLRDELASPLRQDLEANCFESIDEKYFYGSSHLVFDNAWIPTDSAGGHVNNWHVMSERLKHDISKENANQDFVTCVDAMIEKARLDWEFFENLHDWHNGSSHGMLERSIQQMNLWDYEKDVMTEVCHLLQVNRCKTFLHNHKGHTNLEPQLLKNVGEKLIATAMIRDSFASRLDAWRRKAGWEHLLDLAKDAGLDVTDKAVEKLCCEIQMNHNYRIDHPDSRAVALRM